MNKSLACGLLAGLLTCAGCVTTTALQDQSMTPLLIAKSLPSVTPEQITDTNGHQIAQALEEEINREQQQNILNANSR